MPPRQCPPTEVADLMGLRLRVVYVDVRPPRRWAAERGGGALRGQGALAGGGPGVGRGVRQPRLSMLSAGVGWGVAAVVEAVVCRGVNTSPDRIKPAAT